MTKTYISELINKKSDMVNLLGWVENRRDLGKKIFIDLRDSTGLVQVVCDDSAGDIRNEYIIGVKGRVQQRQVREGDSEVLPVEVVADELVIVAKSQTPPFPINTIGDDIDDTLRLKYRYLDLRRKRLQRNIKFRHQYVSAIREFLNSRKFTEIETPLLTKTTPEGARDFVVPSRLNTGYFYALPQSPQQYKQLLMLAGFERYYQLARCLRDEDLRGDRSFEHTQIDLEMSFVNRENVMALVEEMVVQVAEKLGYELKDKPFPRFTYQEVLAKFGADKFDLRTESEKEKGMLSYAWVIDFPLFEKKGEGWTFSHNPFSNPIPEHRDKLLAGEIEGILSSQYDLVCNGYEVGGGSIRSHEPKVLKRVLEVIGHSATEIETEFGHMLEALTYGAPPHGGIALGIERLVTLMLREDNIREVQAFPLSYRGKTAVMDAPSPLLPDQLKELGLAIAQDEKV